MRANASSPAVAVNAKICGFPSAAMVAAKRAYAGRWRDTWRWWASSTTANAACCVHSTRPDETQETPASRARRPMRLRAKPRTARRVPRYRSNRSLESNAGRADRGYAAVPRIGRWRAHAAGRQQASSRPPQRRAAPPRTESRTTCRGLYRARPACFSPRSGGQNRPLGIVGLRRADQGRPNPCRQFRGVVVCLKHIRRIPKRCRVDAASRDVCARVALDQNVDAAMSGRLSGAARACSPVSDATRAR